MKEDRKLPEDAGKPREFIFIILLFYYFFKLLLKMYKELFFKVYKYLSVQILIF